MSKRTWLVVVACLIILLSFILHWSRYQTVPLTRSTGFYKINRWTGSVTLVVGTREISVGSHIEEALPAPAPAPVPSTSMENRSREFFDEMAGKIADKGQRAKFVEDVKNEVKRTGKSPDEVVLGMMPPPAPEKKEDIFDRVARENAKGTSQK